MVRVCKTLNRGSSPLDASMPNETEEEERLRLLNEVRAYGKGVAPFAHTRPEQDRPRGNVYDASMVEWVRSRTFKTMCCTVIALPLFLICVYFIVVTWIVGIGGRGILLDLQRIGGY